MRATWRLRSGCWQASEPGVLDELGAARIDLLRAQIALEQRRGGDAGRLFLSAASRLEPLDPELARETYLEALGGAMANDVEVAGGAAGGRGRRAGGATRHRAPPRTVDVLLDAFAIRLTDGYAAAAPTLARALELLLATDFASEDAGRWLSLSSGRDSNIVALELWDDEALHLLAARQVQAARDAGALAHLQFALSFLARSHMLAGELTAATLMIDEARLIAEATGNPPLVNAPMILAAWRGHEAAGVRADRGHARRRRPTRRWTSNNYARSVLYNGLGRHDAARDAAWEAIQPDPIGYGTLLVPELAEAASRTGDRALLEFALEWLSERTSVDQLRVGDRNRSACARAAERGRGRRGARTASRSRTSPVPACGSSSPGLTSSTGSGCDANVAGVDARSICAPRSSRSPAWAPRRSQAAPNASCWRPASAPASGPSDTRDQLTPQETQIARLAADGHTNREIAAQLFISPSTVEYHLRKVFRKLDVKSRTQLANRLHS